MTRDAFEQLLSRWLDEPQRADLRAAIDAAAAALPELAALRDQHVRLVAALRTLPQPAVDWMRFRSHVDAELDAAARTPADKGDTQLDDALSRLPSIAERVDWARFGARVGAAISAAESHRTVRRTAKRRLLVGSGFAAVAAAAVWMFVLLRPGFQPGQPAIPAPVPVVAFARIEPVASPLPAGATPIASVTISAPANLDPAALSEPAPTEGDEIFFMIRVAAAPAGALEADSYDIY